MYKNVCSAERCFTKMVLRYECHPSYKVLSFESQMIFNISTNSDKFQSLNICKNGFSKITDMKLG